MLRPGGVYGLHDELGKEEGPTGLSSVQFLWLLEVRQVFVVGQDHHGVSRAFEVVSPFL